MTKTQPDTPTPASEDVSSTNCPSARTNDKQVNGSKRCGEAVLTRMSDVEAVPIQWLWLYRIPLGRLTVIAGDPGLGKSFVTLDMAARVSTGTKWPDGRTNRQGSVVLLNIEDDAADTIRPRLDAAGADVERIHLISGVRPSSIEETKPFSLGNDLSPLRDVLKGMPDCRLVVVDPITAYLGGVDTNSDVRVRQVLGPLATLAESQGVAIVLVMHLNKGQDLGAIYRVSGSMAFTAAARATWLVAKDRESPDRRLLLPQKMNLCRNPGGLAFSLTTSGNGERAATHDHLEHVDHPEHPTARVKWEPGRIDVDADSVVGAGDRGPSKLQEAMDFVRGVLVEPMLAKDVEEAAAAEGISLGTLRRAKKVLKVRSDREPGADGRSLWSLPCDHDQVEQGDQVEQDDHGSQG